MEYRDVVYGTYMFLVRLIEVHALIYRLQKTDYILYMPYQHGIYIQYFTSMYTYVHSISYTYYIFLLMYSAYFNCSPPLTPSPLSLSLSLYTYMYISFPLFLSPRTIFALIKTTIKQHHRAGCDQSLTVQP